MTGPSAADNYAGVYEGRLQPGSRPALLIVDVVAAYLTEGSPLFMDTAADALASNARLAATAQAAGVPVVFTKVQYKPDGSDGGVFWRKAPVLRAFVEGSPLGAFPPGLTPQAGDRVVTKQYPSAFFGTGLAETLHAEGIDTLLIGGYSTSGCVRASALDAMQYGFVPLVVREACADRHPAPHEANLFDLQAKYAEVISEAEAMAVMGAACS
ncbi:isochorismatase family protein [Porphyrobacter sp. CACIAM 03H1]|jgi:maleamate amidohydrolase|uniref:isochorismatase family protein n=1 Tax=Porphyrobacter sp. CACIAM 03H1 TaxID=2003315 RepID=UPI000B5A2887|nr:isochorismatase family protein [Porphyrobacter sp. CACIAM 03H1]ASJ91913.1 isochorismatase [Porphyrobacter sp. CACIAM 03H1]